jgi:hypothetical protein
VHGILELWLHPKRFHTRMCDASDACPHKVCFFVHSLAQLRREDIVVPFIGIQWCCRKFRTSRPCQRCRRNACS